MERLEALAIECQASDAQVFASLHPDIQRVLESAGPSGAHLHFLRLLLEESSYEQREAIMHDITHGFPLIGDIPVEASAKPKEVQQATNSPSDLKRGHQEWDALINKHIKFSRLSGIEVASEIWEQTIAEQKLGRITEFIEYWNTDDILPTRRFGVEQQSSKGISKIRCIDDFHESGINDCCSVFGRIRMGHIRDMAYQAKAHHRKHPDVDLAIWKSDFKSAYRCVPILPEHQRYAYIMIYNPNDGSIRIARQRAMPFGSIAAVYAWDRLAHAIVHIIEFYLQVPINRYVDDIFGIIPARYGPTLRNAIIRLVELCGFKLEPSKTPAPASHLVILGIFTKLHYDDIRKHRRLYLKLRLDKDKAIFWNKTIAETITKGSIGVKEASKLAGKLCFTACAILGHTGLCRLHHLFEASLPFRRRNSSIGPSLLAELKWWNEFLASSKFTVIPLRDDLPYASVFTDASGGGGVGAVIFRGDNDIHAFEGHLGSDFTSQFKRRLTNIIPLEMAAVLAAAHRFRPHLRGHNVCFFIDNTSVLHSLRKGHCRASDINRMVISFADITSNLVNRVAFVWVPSAWNISDFPSRGQHIRGMSYVSASASLKHVKSCL